MESKEIIQLWNERLSLTFPEGYGGKEIEGIDPALLDGDIAGCIQTFIKNKGKLDLWRTAILGLCYRDVSIVVEKIEEDVKEYFRRLEILSKLVLQVS